MLSRYSAPVYGRASPVRAVMIHVPLYLTQRSVVRLSTRRSGPAVGDLAVVHVDIDHHTEDSSHHLLPSLLPPVNPRVGIGVGAVGCGVVEVRFGNDLGAFWHIDPSYVLQFPGIVVAR